MNKILTLALPLIISQLIAMTLVLTDVWMMSQISVEALAGGGLGASVYSFVFLIAASCVGCVANLIAIAYGQSLARPEFGSQQIRFAIKGAVMLAVVLTLLLTLIFSLTPELLRYAQQPQAVIEIAMHYLDTLKWAMFPMLILLVLRGLTSNFGDTRSVMLMSVVTVLINVPLSYLLAFQLDWGVAGLAGGTSLSALLVMVGYAFWIFKQPKYSRFAPWRHLSEYALRRMTPLLSMGVPIAIASILEHGLIYGGTLMAGAIGVASLALHQILLQCLSFTWNINFGLAQAAAILVGKDFGAGDRRGIKRTAETSFLLVTLISSALAAVFLIWPDTIASLFQLDQSPADSGTDLTSMLAGTIWVVALCFVVDGWQLLAINILRGMKIVFVPTLLTGLGYWAFGLPAAWLLMPQYGLTGIWGGIGIGLAATGLLLLIQVKQASRPSREQPTPAHQQALSV